MYGRNDIEVMEKKLVDQGVTDWDYLEHLWAIVQRAWNPERDYSAMLKNMYYKNLHEGVKFPFSSVINNTTEEQH